VNVLVDACVWSLALRRKTTKFAPAEVALLDELRELIEEDRARITGPIRQELLSGVREMALFEQLREGLSAFRDEPVSTPDYELAAHLSNRCRRAGITGSPVDFVICSLALSRKWSIFTSDRDFESYRKILGIELYQPRA
jgi:predicted nucleic acid-binding protein